MMAYLTLRLFILIFGYLPFWVLYRIADVLIVIFYVLGVRKKTIIENLEGAFPDLTPREMKKLRIKVYRNFLDVMFVEFLKGFTASTKAIKKRFDEGDLSISNNFYAQSRSVICVLGHSSNWEWGVTMNFQHPCIDFYKPFKNILLNEFVTKNRNRHHFNLQPVSKLPRVFLKNKKNPVAYSLFSDKQNMNSKKLESAVWVPFLGMPTPFLSGAERLARRFNYPVIYSKITRVKRGFYHHELISVSDHPQDTQEGEITHNWVKLLETQILEDPSSWFWFWAASRSRQTSFEEQHGIAS